MSAPTLPMIPIPSKVTPRGAGFSLSATTQIDAADALRPLAERLRDELRQATGFALPVVARATGPRISLALDDGLARLGDEGYRLAASADAVAISAARTAGVMHGTPTLRQLLPPASFRATVVPEIEMPGHALAAIAAYPELGNTGTKHEVQTYWGISEHVFGVGDNVLTFLENVLDEVLALFPSKFIHVGGDECPKTEWKASAAAQARMKESGLKDEDELQSWFITHFDKWLASRGRRLIGWDEILEGGLAPGATVMSWRGENGGVAAAKAGHDVVMAPEKPTYFDHDNSENEPLPIRRLNTLAEVYAYEPVPKELSAAEAKHVLGAQGQLWTEYMPDPQRMEYMAWPRLSALAEVLWSPRETRDPADFARRLDAHLERLRILDVNYWRPRHYRLTFT